MMHEVTKNDIFGIDMQSEASFCPEKMKSENWISEILSPVSERLPSSDIQCMHSCILHIPQVSIFKTIALENNIIENDIVWLASRKCDFLIMSRIK